MTDTSLPPSLWADTATPAEDHPALDSDTDTDVAIVGGGFTGLSAALHLTARGVKPVVLESAEVGWGASGRNGGQVIPGLKYDPRELERMFGAETGGRIADAAGRAADLVFDLIAEHAIDCDAVQTGWIQPAHAKAHLKDVHTRVEDWRRRGAPVEVLDRDQTAALVGTDVYAGGWIDRRAGTVQPLSYARGLARAATSKGAVFHARTNVTGLTRTGDRWRLETPNGAITARAVLLATNGYTDGLWPGLRKTVIPLYSMQIATRPLSENLRRSILPEGQAASDTYRLLTYFRTDAAGRLLIGGRGPFKDRPEVADTAPLRKVMHSLFPQLGDIELDFRWAGRVAVTTDHLPHLHELAPNLYAGLGYNGRGVAMATLMGRFLAELATGADPKDVPFPMTRPKQIPLHFLRRPMLMAMVQAYRLRDRLDRI